MQEIQANCPKSMSPEQFSPIKSTERDADVPTGKEEVVMKENIWVFRQLLPSCCRLKNKLQLQSVVALFHSSKIVWFIIDIIPDNVNYM